MAKSGIYKSQVYFNSQKVERKSCGSIMKHFKQETTIWKIFHKLT